MLGMCVRVCQHIYIHIIYNKAFISCQTYSISSTRYKQGGVIVLVMFAIKLPRHEVKIISNGIY